MTLETILSYWIPFLILIAGLELLEDRKSQLKKARKRWPANLALIAIAAGLSSMVPISGFAAAGWAQINGIGILTYLNLHPVFGMALSLLVLSLWDYLVHLASHKVPLLWRFHKIHHCDLTLDVTTTYRVHPMMHLLSSVANTLMVVCLGLEPNAVIAYAGLVLIIDVSHHTTLRIPARLDQILRPYFITPTLHHIHHSDYVIETDSNYGHDIAFWDRLFKTYLAEPKRPESEFRYGLAQFPETRANDLHALLAAPFKGDSSS
jgi:sterol desaturase/sphingolipid hydroxylase (fatty acid hydroxylase superfamily)